MHRIWGDTFSSPLRFSSCTTNALLTLRIFLTTYFTYFSLPCYFYLLWLTLNTLTHERKTLKRDLSIILNAIIIIPSALIIYRPRWERWEDGRPRMEKRKKIGSRGDNKIEGDKGEDEKYKSNNFFKRADLTHFPSLQRGLSSTFAVLSIPSVPSVFLTDTRLS